MPLYDYQCSSCGTKQEKAHKLNEPQTEECIECGAKPIALIRIISIPKNFKHSSWSTWSKK
jgi:putative FmdB family regulatory protein